LQTSNIFRGLSETAIRCAYSTSATVPDMRQIPTLIDTKVVRPAESALALHLITEMQLLRLKTIAKLHARGLPPDVGWDDLLQEALTRVLVGARLPPKDVPIVPFLAGIPDRTTPKLRK
jgi:hypothetical protein